jgi:hypothetical protein
MDKDKIWCFQDYGSEYVYRYTEQQILDEYWPFWSNKMKELGRYNLMCPDRCIEDWITVNWAWELKPST